jgi:hypothetical protein
MLYSSSTIFSVQLLREAEAQKWFDEICEKNNVPHEASDSVSQLRQIDVDTLVCSSHFACTSFRPILDNITIADDPRNVILDGSRWDDSLEAIVFGHCENEVGLPGASDLSHCLESKLYYKRGLLIDHDPLGVAETGLSVRSAPSIAGKYHWSNSTR